MSRGYGVVQRAVIDAVTDAFYWPHDRRHQGWYVLRNLAAVGERTNSDEPFRAASSSLLRALPRLESEGWIETDLSGISLPEELWRASPIERHQAGANALHKVARLALGPVPEGGVVHRIFATCGDLFRAMELEDLLSFSDEPEAVLLSYDVELHRILDRRRPPGSDEWWDQYDALEALDSRLGIARGLDWQPYFARWLSQQFEPGGRISPRIGFN